MPTTPTLKVRITNVDYALVASGPLDRTSLRKVPIIRIYGQSSAGCKACVHIHQVYPYFFVEYKGQMEPAVVNQYILRLQQSINQAVALSLRQNYDPRHNGKHNSTPRYVRTIAVVKAVHFYGFHAAYAPFLKLFVVDPQHVQRIVTLLQSGTVMQHKFKIFESHLNFVLQFLCDFGLYGCGELEIGRACIRERRVDDDLYDDRDLGFNIDTNVFDISPHGRESHLPLELDVTAPQILNRHLLCARKIHHTINIPAPPPSPEPLVLSVRELWEDERQRRAQQGLPPTPVMPSDGSGGRGAGPIWRAEKRHWADLGKRISNEQDTLDTTGSQRPMDTDWERFVMTSFESVEILWQPEDKTWRPSQKEEEVESIANSFNTSLERSEWEQSPHIHGGERDVDVGLVSSQAMEDLLAAAESRQPEDEDATEDVEPEEVPGNNASAPLVSPRKTPARTPSKLSRGPARADYYLKDRTLSRQTSVTSSTREESREGSLVQSTAKKRPNPFSDSMWTSPAKRSAGRSKANPLSSHDETTPTKSRIYRQPPNYSIRNPNAAQENGENKAAQPRRQIFIGGNGPYKDSEDIHVLPTVLDLAVPATEIDPRAPPTPPSLQEQLAGKDTTSSQPTGSSHPSSQSLPQPGQPKLPKFRSSSQDHVVGSEEVSSPSGPVMQGRVSVSSLATPQKYHALSLPRDPTVQEGSGALIFSPPTSEHSQVRTPDPPSRLSRNADTRREVEDATQKSIYSSTELDKARSSKQAEDSDGKIIKKRRLQWLSQSSPDPSPDISSASFSADVRLSNHSSEDVPRPLSSTSFVYQVPPPTTESLLASLPDLGLPERLYPDAYFSNPKDVMKHPREWAGKLFKLGNTGERGGIGALEHWELGINSGCPDWETLVSGLNNEDEYLEAARRKERSELKTIEKELKRRGLETGGIGARTASKLEGRGVTGWEYVHISGSTRRKVTTLGAPPSRSEVLTWLKGEGKDHVSAFRRKRNLARQSQIAGPTQKNPYGFKATQRKPTENSTRQPQNMSILAIEILSLSRNHLLPNPEEDAIEAIFFCLKDDDMPAVAVKLSNESHSPSAAAARARAERRATYHRGCLAVQSPHIDPRRIRESYLDAERPEEDQMQRTIEVVDSEIELINLFLDRVMEWDPDVLTGWELQNSSWGYLSDRAQLAYSIDVSDLLSRLLNTRGRATGSKEYDATHNSTFKVSGRHVLNTWRIMRVELTLGHYTLENVAYHVLHRRVPNYTAETLTAWYKSEVPAHTARVVEYFMDRTAMVQEILDEADVITKNAEFARVFGIDFFSVLSRGSQFKVESFMARISKPESLMLYSPSREEVGRQNAAECIPLIMEPQSAYYKSPLVVLDFQSLYPSVMIAYNYCYSTCLGRVSPFNGECKFGPTELNVSTDVLERVKDHINIAPNGIMYVNPTVRRGLLGKMLTELLETRVMVKQAMKSSKGDKALLRLLDARQLSLKFICNVTYGYTSASFSGRMPAVEIADSIVQTGRETLEQAISFINSNPKWGARVVYGDTDSLFVSLEGKTKDQAFRIGNDMADAVTMLNPRPIKLKFEKVYFPCLLMAKKRYVGFKYEHPDDKEPIFDAKGIETVRRDGVPAGQKMVETCIKILFRTQDLSEVKEYCRLSWTKLLDGQVSIYDFIFSKEVKLGKYSDKVTPPPGVVVAARRLARDPRGEPQHGDRVPYVITRSFGALKSRLVDRAFSPQELLHDRQQYQLDAVYYIEQQLIPPLQRVFDLVGADVKGWYDEMPKGVRSDAPDLALAQTHKAAGKTQPKLKFTIDAHFQANVCVACGGKSTETLCTDCKLSPESTIFALQTRLRVVHSRSITAQQVCASCTATPAWDEIKCESLDCRWLFERFKVNRERETLEGISNIAADSESWMA